MRASLQTVESDLASGGLARPDFDIEAVYTRAETLSAKQAATNPRSTYGDPARSGGVGSRVRRVCVIRRQATQDCGPCGVENHPGPGQAEALTPAPSDWAHKMPALYLIRRDQSTLI